MSMRIILVLLAIIFRTTNAVAQDQPPRDPSLACAVQLRQYGIGAHFYAQAHDGKLPPDLYTMLSTLAEQEKKATAEVARAMAVSPAHASFLKPPADITPAWINDASSYRYLGNADVSMNDIQEWGDVVVAHLRLEKGHSVGASPMNPEGEVFTLVFLDGHVQTSPRAEAERLIAKSIATFESLRTGADAPPDRQALQSLALILRAITAYAKANDGRLPPDLGATLPHVPADTKSTATPRQRARIFLSPAAQKSAAIPDEPTPDWVNANTWYTYLGHPDLHLADIPEPGTLVLIHSRLQDPLVEVGIDGAKAERLAVGEVGGQARLATEPYTRWIVRESERTFLSIRTDDAPALPDWVHAMRDARAVGVALRAYTKQHDNALPASLALLLPLIETPLAGKAAPAAVFLSPRDELTMSPPAAADLGQWVAAHASWVSLVRDGDRVPTDVPWRPVFHGPLDQPYRILSPNEKEPVEVIPCIDPMGYPILLQKKWLLDLIKPR